jgi:hypothetical protein
MPGDDDRFQEWVRERGLDPLSDQVIYGRMTPAEYREIFSGLIRENQEALARETDADVIAQLENEIAAWLAEQAAMPACIGRYLGPPEEWPEPL